MTSMLNLVSMSKQTYGMKLNNRTVSTDTYQTSDFLNFMTKINENLDSFAGINEKLNSMMLAAKGNDVNIPN